MACMQSVVQANDAKIVAVHKEFVKWKAKHPEFNGSKWTDFGRAMRHFNK